MSGNEWAKKYRTGFECRIGILGFTFNTIIREISFDSFIFFYVGFNSWNKVLLGLALVRPDSTNKITLKLMVNGRSK